MFARLDILTLRIAARLNRPRAVLLAALLVALPTLFSGLFFDDYLHLLTLRGDGFGPTPFDLFQFATGDVDEMAEYISTGPFPWYTWPALKLHFFRPLSSAAMVLDFHLFGQNAVLYHLHSMAWYMLLAWGVFLIYRRLFALPIAGLCILLYILDDGHLIPVLWWSNRNAIVSAAPAVLGLAAHLRWRETGWRPGLPLSLLGYGLGLLGGETALGIVGYVAAYELVKKTPWRDRVRCLAPAVVVAVVYLMAYKRAGYGVAGSGIYVDPIAEWPTFLSLAPGRLLDLAGTQLFNLPVELAIFAPGTSLPLGVAALAGLAVFGVVLFRMWKTFGSEERRNLAWLGIGAILAAAPGLATFPSGRLLLLPSIGACAWLGLFLSRALAELGGVRGLGDRATRSITFYFLVIHLLLAPLTWVGASLAVPVFIRLSEDAFHAIELDAAKVANQRVFCLFAADPYTGFYPVVMRRYLHYPPARGWQILSLAAHDHEVTRTGPNRFELRVVEGEMLSTPFERLMRSHTYPLKKGDVVACAGYRVTVLEAGSWGPRSIALDFDKSLDDPEFAFLAWQGGRLARFAWPPIGSTARLKVSEGYFAWKYFKKRLSVL